MITSIDLENLRIFQNPGCTFTTAPLTILCGTNSSGKSTILKSLLLLRQSQGIHENDSGINGKLRLVGNQIDLGAFSSIVSNNDTKSSISIGITIEDVLPVNALPKSASIKKTKKDTIPYQLHSKFTFALVNPPEEENEESSFSNFEQDFYNIRKEKSSNTPSRKNSRQGTLILSEFTIIVEQKPIMNWLVKLSTNSSKKNEPLSYELLVPVKQFDEAPKERYFKDLFGALSPKSCLHNNVKYYAFDTKLKGLLPDRVVVKSNEIENHFPLNFFNFLYWGANEDFVNALKNIHYLAPLRLPAERFYLANYDSYPILDPAGQFLPYVLRDSSNSKVKNYYLSTNSIQESKLKDALDYWLHFLRTGKYCQAIPQSPEIEMETSQHIFVELTLKTLSGNYAHSLADSGFGYSQVLPILVRALLARPFETIVIEQPELHLNPSLQVRLCEFFLAMTKVGKQIILETHSEHIVNAVRVLIAEDSDNKIYKQCKILYVGNIDYKPLVYDLSIQQNGMVPNWPTSFFGEAATLSGRLLRAQKKMRNK